MAKSIEENGICVGVRGNPWIIHVSNVTPPFKLLSWGHMVMGAYRAQKRQLAGGWSNPYVASTISKGLDQAVVFSARTPKDVVKWIIDLGNMFHDLSTGKSFTETMSEVEKAESEWKVYRITNNITSRSGLGSESYVKLYEKCLKNAFPNLCSSWQSYESKKAFISTLDKHGWLAEFKEYFQKNTNFLDKTLSTFVVLNMFHNVSLLVCSVDFDFEDQEVKKALFFELCKYCVPLKETEESKTKALGAQLKCLKYFGSQPFLQRCFRTPT